MEEIVEELLVLQEDKPYLILTNDIIKDYIMDHIDLLVEEIKEELSEY